MKIVHILLGKANPNTMNGVNKVVYHLATEQTKLGHEVTLCAISNNPKIDFEHIFNINVFQVKKSRFLLNKALKAFIQSLTSDMVVHIHSVFIPEFYSIVRLLKQKQIKYIFSPHGAYHPASLQKNHLIKKLYIALFESKILNTAYKIHAIGKNEVAEIQALTANKNIYLLQNGTEIINVKITKQIKKKDETIFCYCGRLSKNHKGLDMLLEGFAQFLKSQQDKVSYKLWLIGDGEDKAFLQNMVAQLQINNNVVFWGKQYGDEKNNLIAQSDCFVHTSRWDGMPIAVLEAAALGIPLFITDATNMGDFVKEFNCGIVVKKNANAIYNGLLDFMANKANLSSSISMVKNRFIWNEVAQQHLKNYAK